MPRWASISIGVGVVALVIAITAKAFHGPMGRGTEQAGRPEDSGIIDDGRTPGQRLRLAATVPPSNDFTDTPGETLRGDSGSMVFADGTPVPPLPASAPRQVRFGVVL